MRRIYKLSPNQQMGIWDNTKVNYKFEISEDYAKLYVYYGRKKIGMIGASRVYSSTLLSKDLKCQSDVDNLSDKHSSVLHTDWKGNVIPKVWSVYRSQILDEYHGRKIGKQMYLSLAKEIYRKNGSFIYISDKCSAVGSTSDMAMWVWRSLARELPSSGTCCAIVRQPKIRADK